MRCHWWLLPGLLVILGLSAPLIRMTGPSLSLIAEPWSQVQGVLLQNRGSFSSGVVNTKGEGCSVDSWAFEQAGLSRPTTDKPQQQQ